MKPLRIVSPVRIVAAAVAAICLACLPVPLQAQAGWQTSGNTIYAPAGTKVGIGTSMPAAGLQTQTTDDPAPPLIGAWDSRHVAVTNGTGGLGISYSSTNNAAYISVLKPSVAWGSLVLQPYAASGNVGIGTISPQYKLAVNGTIGAREVIVTNTGWADYVFKPDYQPKPLSEVAAYIKEHRHLPGIPSEKEVRENGVSLGDMQIKLLAKIEELTLHMIQANERSDRLEQQNRDLLNRLQEQNLEFEKQNQASRIRIARLEALVERQIANQGRQPE